MEIKKLKRVFRFKKNGSDVTLPDPDPAFSVEDVLRFYSGQYPELTTATFDEPRVDGNKAVYEVKTSVGTKA